MGINPAKNKKIMALDVGSKTIGVALSDSLHQFATPYALIERGKWTADAAQIAKIIAVEQVGAIILGLPKNMDGSEGPKCQSVRQFARNLSQYGQLAEIPIHFWDERLSTAAVERDMIAQDVSRAKRAETVDMAAAAFILQGVLDHLRIQADSGNY